MSRAPRYAQRKDLNQQAIVQALEMIGCSVWVMHTPCDLLVGRSGPYGPLNLLIEVKNPKVPLCDRKLTPAQVEFRKTWRGQFAIVETVDEAIAVATA